MTDIAAIAALIEPEVKALGFDLVRVAMIGGTSDPTLQVMAERPDTRQLDLDDCADDFAPACRRCSTPRKRRDPIEGAYRLEVSSPGIDRPLTRRCRLCRLGRPRSAASSSPSRSTAPSRCPGSSRASTATRHISTPKGGRARPVRSHRVGQAAA